MVVLSSIISDLGDMKCHIDAPRAAQEENEAISAKNSCTVAATMVAANCKGHGAWRTYSILWGCGMELSPSWIVDLKIRIWIIGDTL